MADTKDQVVETTEAVEEQQTTTHEQPISTSEPFRFTQDELDEVVAKRLAREREAFAKKLGVEKFEQVDSFLETYKTTVSEKEELNSKYETVITQAFDKEIRLQALLSGVKPEHLDRVVKLTTTELESLNEDEELDIAKTMSIVLEEFPMFVGSEPQETVRKIGQQPNTDSNSKTEIERYNEKWKNSKYWSK
jgi:hypothetical protein